MGSEALGKFSVNGKTGKAKARLETDVLQLHGADVRLSIPFKAMRNVRSSDGVLRFEIADDGPKRSALRGGGPERPALHVALELGSAATKWADKILHPPSRLAKIGVKPEWRVATVGIGDEDFLAELEQATAAVSIGRAVKNCDAIFFGATSASQLARLSQLKKSLKPAGALWVVRPKGRPEISESAVMQAGKAAGLVDVKVVSFSATHTAEKFVIPVKDR